MLTIEDIQKRIGVAQVELEQVHSDLMILGHSNSGGIAGAITSMSRMTGITAKIEMLRSKIELLELMKEIVEVKEDAMHEILEAKRQIEL